MPGRYSGPLGKQFSGDRDTAASLQSRVRVLVQSIFDTIKAKPIDGKGSLSRSWNMEDGSVIHAYVNTMGVWPIVRTWIESPVLLDARGESGAGGLFGGFIYTPAGQDATLDPVFLATVIYAADAASDALWLLVYQKSVLKLYPSTPYIAAHVNWYSVRFQEERREESVLSYNHGLSSRYRLYPNQDCSGRLIRIEPWGTPIIANSGVVGLYKNGRYIPTVYTSPDGYQHNCKVVGAGVCSGYLVFVTHWDLDYRPDPEATRIERAQAQSRACASRATVLYARPGAEWRVAGTHHFDFFLKSPWVFNATGREAVAVKDVSIHSQSKLTITLHNTDDGLAATFTDEALTDVQPFMVERIRDSGIFSEQFGYLGGGPWTCRLQGGISFYDQNIGSWVSFSVGPTDVPLSGLLGAAQAMSDELLANLQGGADISGPDMNSYQWLVDNENNAGIGAGDLGIFMSYAVNNLSFLGHLYLCAFKQDWRELPKTVGGFQAKTTYAVTGKRYLAFDYANNTQIPLTLSLISEVEGDDPVNEFYRVEDLLQNFVRNTACYTQTSKQFRRYQVWLDVQGEISWVLRCGDHELVRASGGVKKKMSRMYLYESDLGVAVRQRKIDEDLSPVFIERIWLKDVDARVRACVCERLRGEFTIESRQPQPDLEWEDETSLGRYRFSEVNQIATSEIISREGVEVSHVGKNDFVVPTLRAFAFSGQLVPRWYDRDNGEMELFIPPYYTAGSGWYAVTANRVFGLSVDDAYPLRLRDGMMQSRYSDWIATNTNEILAASEVVIGGVQRVENPASVNFAVIGGNRIQLETLDYDEPLTDPFMTNPICTV